MAQIISDAEVAGMSLAWLKITELIYKSPYIPVSELRPSKRQVEVLAYDGEENLFGGAVGGGKSDCLLMDALMYVTVPGYAALILRRTYRHLVMDGGLVPRSKEWIGDKATFKEKTMQWTFPHGSTLTFGYFDHDDDRNLYLGGAWQTVCWDEATSFKPAWYEFLFSRLRRADWICKNCKLPLWRENFTKTTFQHKLICKNCRQSMLPDGTHKDKFQTKCSKPEVNPCQAAEPVPMPMNHLGMSIADVPIRVRAASNPGGPAHDYFKRRFVVPGAPKRFVKSLLSDNPGLNREDYEKQLNKLDPITREQYLNGDWNAYQGGRFKKHWFREFWVEEGRAGQPVYKWSNTDIAGKIHNNWPTCPYDGIPIDKCFNFITCDPASSNDDKNDYTAIGVFSVTPSNEIFVLEVVRERMDLEEIVPRIDKLSGEYGAMFVGIEDVAFQRGIIREGQRSLGVPVERLPTEGKSKLVRATPCIIRASEGQYFVPKDEPQGKFPWLEDYLAELIQFTGDEKLDSYDDCVDITAYSALALLRHGLLSPTVVTPDRSDDGDDDYRGGIFMHTWER